MHAIIFIKNVFAVVVSVDHLVHYCVFALLLRHRMVFAHNDLIQNQYKTLNNNSEFQYPINLLVPMYNNVGVLTPSFVSKKPEAGLEHGLHLKNCEVTSQPSLSMAVIK
jgi:hypothetical protein